jgi:hypothetical protein
MDDNNIGSSGKLCTHCKWCAAHPELVAVGHNRIEQYQCFHPNNIVAYSPVDGSPTFKNPHCDYHRKQGTAMVSYCRAEGAWWEVKPVQVATVNTKAAISGSDFDLPTIDKNAVAAKIAAAKAARTNGNQKVATNLLTDLGL